MSGHIRNFAIVAHIDHGKSTLADRLIQTCGGLTDREMRAQVLDNMELERERGITIKSQAVRLLYATGAARRFELNLVDTPGHVDFAYEVSRSLSACEGALLVVDACQGVEAQTLANVYAALENDLVIIPVLNKMDLPQANPERVLTELQDVIGLNTDDVVCVSAKTGQVIDDLLRAVVARVPAPAGSDKKRLQCLLIDSWYDSYDGVMMLVRVMEGTLARGDEIFLMQAQAGYTVDRLGFFSPKMMSVPQLTAGQIGFISGNIKNISDCKVGDTITRKQQRCERPLAGFRRILPVVFCGIFPAGGAGYGQLRKAVEKLALNDAGFSFESENSTAFGSGFRCGFLGLLHMEIIQERLRREYALDLILTAPSVVYEVTVKGSDKPVRVYSPRDVPEPNRIVVFKEPWVKVTILVDSGRVGGVLSLCTERRGRQVQHEAAGDRMMVIWELPLNEIVFDFHDRLKSITSGYASFDYEPVGMREGDLVKLDILLNQEVVEAFSVIAPRLSATSRGRQICKKLKTLLPRQNYKVAIQAAIGGKVVARETMAAYRKDVTAKCYGGDVTRKRKLLEKQKAGKKRMQTTGKMEIPRQAFIKALKMEDQ